MRNQPGDNEAYAIKYLSSHLVQSCKWENLIELLSNYRYVERKTELGLKFDLVREYRTAQRVLPNPYLTPAAAGKLTDWLNFVSSHVHRLNTSLEPFVQLAYNYCADGYVASATENQAMQYPHPWLRLCNRPSQSSLANTVTFTGHKGSIDKVIILEDGIRAVSGSRDGSMRVWDINSGDCLFTEEHGAAVSALIAVPNTEVVLSGDDNGMLRLWNLKDQRCSLLAAVQAHTSSITDLSVTRDGTKLLSAGKESIRIWGLRSGECQKEVECGYRKNAWTAAITPDGSKFVAGGRNGDGWLGFWDCSTGECYRTTETDFYIYDIAVTSDSQFAITASSRLQIWDIKTGKCVRELLENGEKVNAEFVEILLDQQHLLCGWNNNLQIWNIETGTCEQKMDPLAWVKTLAFTPDGRHFLCGGRDWKLKLWSLENINQAAAVQKHQGQVTKVDISSNGLAASGGRDAKLRIWTGEGECLHTFDFNVLVHEKYASERVEHIKITGDQQYLVAGTSSRIGVWDLASSHCQWVRETKGIRALTLTPDDREILFGGTDGILNAWDLHTGKEIQSVPTYEKVIHTIFSFLNHNYVMIHSDQSQLWDIGQGLRINKYQGEIKAISRDGSLCIGISENKLCVWDTWSGERIDLFRIFDTIESGTFYAFQLAYIEEKGAVLHSDSQGALYLWDLHRGRCIHKMIGHTSFITKISILPGGGKAVSSSWDKSVRVWDLGRGKEIAGFVSEIDNEESTPVFALSPDGSRLIIGEGTGHVNIFDLSGFET